MEDRAVKAYEHGDQNYLVLDRVFIATRVNGWNVVDMYLLKLYCIRIGDYGSLLTLKVGYSVNIMDRYKFAQIVMWEDRREYISESC